MATTKSCDKCGERFIARDIKNRFCSADCRVEWWSQEKNSPVTLTCEVCNSDFEGSVVRKYCSQFCREVATATLKQKVSDEDIAYVILLNPGCGLQRLRKEFGSLLRTQKRAGGPMKRRIFGVCEYYKTEHGIDLYSILQDPDYMQKITVSEYLKKTGSKFLPPGQGINGGNRTALKKYRNGSMALNKGQKYVRVDLREFNWGRLAQSED